MESHREWQERELKGQLVYEYSKRFPGEDGVQALRVAITEGWLDQFKERCAQALKEGKPVDWGKFGTELRDSLKRRRPAA